MKSAVYWRGVCVATVIAACGPAPSASSPQTPDQPDTQQEDSKQAAPSLAEQRAGFIDGCSKRVPDAPDYCQCSWDLLISMFSESEMSAPDADPRRMEEYKQKLGPMCGGKIPEEFAKKKFLTDCTRQGKKLAAYCDCAWPELRKSLSVADLTLADHASAARIRQAKQSMVKVCEKSLPESVPRDDFINGCLKNNPDARPFCECAWKQLRSAHSPAEIASGLADLEAVKSKIQSSCAKLHPEHKPG